VQRDDSGWEAERQGTSGRTRVDGGVGKTSRSRKEVERARRKTVKARRGVGRDRAELGRTQAAEVEKDCEWSGATDCGSPGRRYIRYVHPAPDSTGARSAAAKFQRPSNVVFLLLMSHHYLEKKRINLLRVLAARLVVIPWVNRRCLV